MQIAVKQFLETIYYTKGNDIGFYVLFDNSFFEAKHSPYDGHKYTVMTMLPTNNFLQSTPSTKLVNLLVSKQHIKLITGYVCKYLAKVLTPWWEHLIFWEIFVGGKREILVKTRLICEHFRLSVCLPTLSLRKASQKDICKEIKLSSFMLQKKLGKKMV